MIGVDAYPPNAPAALIGDVQATPRRSTESFAIGPPTRRELPRSPLGYAQDQVLAATSSVVLCAGVPARGVGVGVRSALPSSSPQPIAAATTTASATPSSRRDPRCVPPRRIALGPYARVTAQVQCRFPPDP
jgi:hypothetical protein